MVNKSRNLTFYYKKIKLDDNLTFQKIIESLDHLTPEQRKHQVGNKTYILNHITSFKGMYYGEIICYETNKGQGIIHDLVSNNNLLERTITTRDVATESEHLKDSTSEFVNSRIIFGLNGNNIAISPSLLGLDRFTTYFNYLLETYYWKNPEDSKSLLMSDVYQKSLKEKLKTTHVRNVKIGQGVQTEISNSSNDKPYELKEKSILAKLSDIAGKQLGFGSTLDDSNVRVNVTIDYLRNTSTEGQKLLDDLTIALATIDESFIEIYFEDGTEYKKGNIRVKGNIKQQILKDNNFDRVKLAKDIYAFLIQSLD